MKPEYQVGIVGAGFAGLVAALGLKKAGKHSFVIFERASEIGGTWRDNIYPGCACDIAVHLYSFAKVPNAEWSNLYAGQPEILDYLKNVSVSYDLQSHIRLNADIVEARFLEEESCWIVIDRVGRETTVSILLLGLGPLNRPFIPTFKELDKFQGAYFHTSQWDKNFDPTGKRVAVIGTGASAIQVVPNLAPLVKQLTVMQRTPPWIMDRFDKRISETSKKMYQRFPVAQRFKREFFYWINEFFGLGFIGNKTLNRVMAWTAVRKLSKEVKDAATREKLTPRYTIGCKRILKSDDYYPTFNRDNVSLVTEGIDRFTEHGILTNDGKEHLLDAVIFATGFIAADLDLYIKVLGVQGRDLVDEWKTTGAQGYLGTTISGYPHLGILLGPNTGLGHNSILHMIESQMNYILQYIDYIEKSGAREYVDLKPSVQDAYNERIQAQLKNTVWASGCRSWYMNSNGKNTTLYPGLTITFRNETKKFDPLCYQKVRQSALVS
jgi:cation diffusion facilitator CzcD-associated flavoprotein CzcO